MKHLAPLTSENAPQASQAAFATLQKQLGMLPNLYATIGHSGPALNAYLAFDHSLQSEGSFSNKEVQAVLLAVSEVNQCTYCLAAHTALAKMNGFSEEDTFGLRAGTIADEKLAALTQLARELTETRGRAADELVAAFFAAGYSPAALVELLGLVSAKIFSNYLHNLTQVPVDFPEAKPLPKTA